MKEKVIAVFDIGKTNKKIILFNYDLNVVSEKEQRFRSVFGSLPQEFVHNEVSGISDAARRQAARQRPQAIDDTPSGPKPVQKKIPKVGRNSPCPCGSGKKYKKCCGQ